MSASWFDPGSWFSSGDGSTVTVSDPGSAYNDVQPITPTYDTTPVTPTDTTPTDTSSGGYSTNSQVFPDPGSPTGYSDIYGNQVDSSGQPVTYDSSGQLIDSNGNVIGNANDYKSTSTANTTTTTDANGNLVTRDSNGNIINQNESGGYDANGNPLPPTKPGVQQPGTQQPGTQQPGTQQPGNNNSTGSSGLLGTLGMLAAGAGVGALLSNLLGNKSNSTGTATVAPAHAATVAPSNLSYTQLANPGTNPGYAMGQPVAPVQPFTTNLGQLNPGPTQITNPINLMPINPTPAPNANNLAGTPVPTAPVAPTAAPGSINPTGLTGQPLSLDQIKSMIGM